MFINILVILLMIIVSNEVFSYICLLVLGVEFLVWFVKHTPT